MTGFRITKYDPALRSPDGSYTKEEWTSVSDIGQIFIGRSVELSEYIDSENAYVEAARQLLGQLGVRCLQIADLESNDDLEALPEPLRTETGTHLSSIQEGQVVCNEELDWAIRLALREVIWCRLEDANGNYIHFGHDYYMYAGSTSKHVATPSLPDGMFAEIFESPYHRDFD